MLSLKNEKTIINLIYFKLTKLIDNNDLDYIKNDIIEYIRNECKLDLYKFDDIYNYLDSEIKYNRLFREIKDIEIIQQKLMKKFNKYVDKTYIKNIFIELKKSRI